MPITAKFMGPWRRSRFFCFGYTLCGPWCCFGASLAASLTTFTEAPGHGDWPDHWAFQLVYRLVGHLWNAQRKGESLSELDLLGLEERASERQLLLVMQHLQAMKIVTRDQEDRWLLARDLEGISLGELYHGGHYYLPLTEENSLPNETAWDGTLIRSLAEVHDKGEAVLNRSLREMYQESLVKKTDNGRQE